MWGRAGQSCDSSPFLLHFAFCLPCLVSSIPDLRPVHPFSRPSAGVSSSSQFLSMDPDSRGRHEKPFSCDVCDHRFATTSSLGRHKRTAHSDVVFKCPQPGCEHSSSRKDSVVNHFEGVHGTAGSFTCDHPGCIFRSSWLVNIANHKRQVHSSERPFACDHTGCSYRAKVSSALSSHKNAVHLNIRDKRCHVCEKGFHSKWHLTSHMATHEGDGHEVAKCEDCSVNLRSKSSHNTFPAAGKLMQCDHQGCDYVSRCKNTLLSHKKHEHSEERPFSCNHTGCSFRCKTKSRLTLHQNQVHLKIKTKTCHICDKLFFSKPVLRVHMMSQHQTKNHDMDECGDCVVYLKRNHKLSQALRASRRRRDGKGGTDSTANMQDIQPHNEKAKDNEENSFAFKEMGVECEATDLNDDLIDMHTDMQLLSSLCLNTFMHSGIAT